MATVVAARARWQGERTFFTGMALALAAATFIGFAPTYYLSPWTDAPALGPLVHLHGVTFTAWILLYVMQTGLIAARRPGVHRATGRVVAVFAVAIVVIGVLVAIESAQLGHGPPTRHQPSFLVFPLTNMAMFAVFTTLGIVYRQRADFHKRLMLLATMGLVITPLARISRMLNLPFDPPAIGGMLLSDLFLLALVAFDLRRRGRIHPATLWGGGFYLLSEPLRVAVGQTQAWQSFASSLIG